MGSIGIKNSIRPVWRKSLYPSMSIDILTVNRGIKNSCILSRRKSLMALYHGTQAIITFLLNTPLYSEFVECRYPSSVKISTVKDSKYFHSKNDVTRTSFIIIHHTSHSISPFHITPVIPVIRVDPSHPSRSQSSSSPD